MIDKKRNRNGLIYVEGKQFSFYINNYEVTLTDLEMINNSHESIKIVELKGPFIYGIDSDRNRIAIYIGASRYLLSKSTFFTDLYIVGNDFLQKEEDWTFGCLECNGGILQMLRDFSTSESIYYFNGRDGKCSIEIGCKYKNSWEKVERVASEKQIGVLKVRFPKMLPINELPQHLWRIKYLSEIMAFRTNVSFDEVILYGQKQNDRTVKMQVFLRENFAATKKWKEWMITFEGLGDCVHKLAELIYCAKKSSEGCEIGFLPVDDEDVWTVNSSRITEIYSAWQYELQAAYKAKKRRTNIFSNREEAKEGVLVEMEAMEKLKISVKEFVQMKLNERGLSGQSNMYAYLEKEINKWGLSARDMFGICCKEHIEEIKALEKCIEHYPFAIWGYNFSDEKLKRWIAYRNAVVHGRYAELTDEIKMTTYILRGIVYCCLLQRIGLKKEKIIKMCENFQICN